MARVILLLLLALGLWARECYSLYGTVRPDIPIFYPDSIDTSPCSNQLYTRKRKLAYGCFRDPKKVKGEELFSDVKVIPYNKAHPYLIEPPSPKFSHMKVDLARYAKKREEIYRKAPRRFYGTGITVLPITTLLNLLPLNTVAYYLLISDNFDVIVLSDGVYNLESVRRRLGKRYIERTANGYVLKAPIYISPTATLVVRNERLLLEAYPKRSFIVASGSFYLLDSTVEAWDEQERKVLLQPRLSKAEALQFRLGTFRPYMLFLAGSKVYMLDSSIRGLGFHGIPGRYGISFIGLADLQWAKGSLFKTLLATLPREGYLIGNDISECYFGFFSSYATNIHLVANYFHDNLYYNIDPHDYTTDLYIVANVATRAKLAHGIVISCVVDGSVIARNVAIDNNSVGIMLDRDCQGNFIQENLVLANGINGITVQESDSNFVYANKIFANRNDGIFVRNSLGVEIVENEIAFNGKSGVEGLSKDLSSHIYRDFHRDPYHRATSLYVGHNRIEENFFSGVTIKNQAAITLEANRLQQLSKYDGDLRVLGNGRRLYGIGYDPYLYRLERAKIKESFWREILHDLKITDLRYVRMLAKGDLPKLRKELQRRSAFLLEDRLYFLGLLGVRDYIHTKKGLHKAAVLLWESALLGNKEALKSLYGFYLLIKNDKTFWQRAFDEAKRRIEREDVGVVMDTFDQKRLEFLRMRSRYLFCNDPFEASRRAFMRVNMVQLKHSMQKLKHLYQERNEKIRSYFASLRRNRCADKDKRDEQMRQQRLYQEKMLAKLPIKALLEPYLATINGLRKYKIDINELIDTVKRSDATH